MYYSTVFEMGRVLSFISELPSHTQGRKYHFLCVTDYYTLKENITTSILSMAYVKIHCMNVIRAL